MKKVLSFFLLLCVSLGLLSVPHADLFDLHTSFLSQSRRASGAVFLNVNGKRTSPCSGTVIAPGAFLTARHCVVDGTWSLYTENPGVTEEISMADNEAGPFYTAVPIAISITDDIAILGIVNGWDLPSVRVGSEKVLRAGDEIFNISFPKDAGKLYFSGQFVASAFPHFPRDWTQYQTDWWSFAMPFNGTIGHGSSGSGIFDPHQKALIGVVVGATGEGNFNIAIPASRVQNLLVHLTDNSPEKFRQAHPIDVDYDSDIYLDKLSNVW